MDLALAITDSHLVNKSTNIPLFFQHVPRSSEPVNRSTVSENRFRHAEMVFSH